MQITNSETRETRYYVRDIEFDGVGPILLERRYSHGGKEFLPDFASATWNHGGDITRIQVSGHVLKKDRSIGQQRASIDYDTPHSRSWGTKWAVNAPDWALELFGIEAAK